MTCITVTAPPPADREDCERAEAAARTYFVTEGINGRQALASYQAWKTDPSTPTARVWSEAREHASIALTQTWAHPSAEIDFDMVCLT